MTKFLVYLVRTKMISEFVMKVKQKKVGMMAPLIVLDTFSGPSQLVALRK